MKSVRIQSFSGPYSVWMLKNTDQKNSEYGHFSRSVVLKLFLHSDKFQSRCSYKIILMNKEFEKRGHKHMNIFEKNWQVLSWLQLSTIMTI